MWNEMQQEEAVRKHEDIIELQMTKYHTEIHKLKLTNQSP